MGQGRGQSQESPGHQQGQQARQGRRQSPVEAHQGGPNQEPSRGRWVRQRIRPRPDVRLTRGTARDTPLREQRLSPSIRCSTLVARKSIALVCWKAFRSVFFFTKVLQGELSLSTRWFRGRLNLSERVWAVEHGARGQRVPSGALSCSKSGRGFATSGCKLHFICVSTRTICRGKQAGYSLACATQARLEKDLQSTRPEAFASSIAKVSVTVLASSMPILTCTIFSCVGKISSFS